MNCNSDSFLIPENDEDNNLVIKWNTLELPSHKPPKP